MLEILIWVLIFVVSLLVLVKSADWFVESAEKIGLALKISPFIVGVIIVAVGTSFPELVSGIFAAVKNATDIVSANIIGSNIANILLIVGLSAVVAKHLIVTRSLIDLDAPLLGATTILFLFISLDKKIVLGEAIILLFAFLVYFLYTALQSRQEQKLAEPVEVLPSRHDRRKKKILQRESGAQGEKKAEKLTLATFGFLIAGAVGLAVGANYTIESVIKLSELLKISTSLIAITAVAVGTSLPELIVSAQAARKKKYEIALGNIFGSNVFNFLLIGGVCGLIKPLVIDQVTFSIGLPFLMVATFLFIISGISQRIHIWEGAMYLLLYLLFIVKLAGIF